MITKEGFTRGNTAAVIGTEGDLLPHTLIGWVLLIIVVLVAVLVANMIYAAPEKRRKAREEEEKKKEGESLYSVQKSACAPEDIGRGKSETSS